ncbi:peptidylprolyl isomerase [Thauera linaloolentis]|uniref:Chaperone SurA n=1 Tax=Thauera linaloolentis (strain DSM 12138 / JCM 21573 / CCUG 41526 / CIP 105981 / IAM 15112 / NBRC 102519 / 47Lol) TaxID=1123367 RepID=N6Y7Z2_THAL4|nr:peptidylprolyl isomerase [Thauera linaloolentis]ENO90371.1 SurA domain-containing protein [Thauera linaloolentis 47Lol = DSM 12138]MCM8564054.1 peptidylprolyl isomerase [Thauera linaloolentis]
MNRTLSRPRLLLAAGLASLALNFPLHAAPQAVAVDRIVAVVNDEVITALQLRARVDQVVRQLQRQGVELPPKEVLEQQLLERLIVERAQLQLARDTSLRVDDATLARAIERIAANNQLGLEQLRETLERDGVSWSRFRDEIRTEILLTRLREREVESKIVVTEAEIDNFLASNPDAFSGQEFEVAHILLRAPEQASPQQIEALRQRAEGVMARLRSGEDFARVAAEVSDAPDGLSGGSLGWRALDRLPALFAEAVRNMRPGETSPVMRSASGLHIVRLIDRRGGGDTAVAQMEQTRARHILIKTSEVLSDTDAEARLLGIRERVVNGADFADLAKANSADLSAAKGGDLGWLNPGDTVPEFERAMNALQPGEISAPVQSPFGWHLIQVVERRVQDVTDERKRNAARAALRDRKADEAYEDWLRQLRDSTYVDLRLDRE